jgi:cytochrome oxidase Cu insertion factor (SCO1/SenC/PrrC family)
MKVRKPAPGVLAPVLVCLVLGALGGVGTALVTKPEARAQAARFTLPRQPPPHFWLRDESGTVRTPASARGEVLVVTFIYTRCRDLCPRQAAEIKDAVLRAGGGVEVYAITVDPEHDTPERARAWLKRMGVAGGPVHILLGSRRELAPVWAQFGIVPIANAPRHEGQAESAEEHEEYEEYEHEYDEHGGEAARRETLEYRPAPAAAHEDYPALEDGAYRGLPRHAGGLDYEHSAYALLIDKRGRQRVGFPYEQLTSDLLLTDLLTLKAES